MTKPLTGRCDEGSVPEFRVVEMIIQKDSILLRPWKTEDAERLAEIANNKNIYDNLRDGFPHPYSIEDAKKYISGAQEDNNQLKIFAIVVDGIVAGSIGAFFLKDVYRKNAEIGYYLAEEYWGRGIMTKVIKAITEYLFDNFDIIRVYAEPFARNFGSRRVLEKAGYRFEALLKSNVIKNNEIEDSCIFAILRNEHTR